MTVSVVDRHHLQRILSVSNDSTSMCLAGPSSIVPHIAGIPQRGNHDIKHNLFINYCPLIVFAFQIISFLFLWDLRVVSHGEIWLVKDCVKHQQLFWKLHSSALR